MCLYERPGHCGMPKSLHFLQALTHAPGVLRSPTMYPGLLAHSPDSAHALQVGFWSLHPPLDGGGEGGCHRKGSAWIHFVMVHFSPCTAQKSSEP